MCFLPSRKQRSRWVSSTFLMICNGLTLTFLFSFSFVSVSLSVSVPLALNVVLSGVSKINQIIYLSSFQDCNPMIFFKYISMEYSRQNTRAFSDQEQSVCEQCSCQQFGRTNHRHLFTLHQRCKIWYCQNIFYFYLHL